MSKFLESIHAQPQNVREIMFGLSVVIAVSLVGTIWFKDFKKDMYTLLNPEDVQQERFLAQGGGESLFGTLGQTLGDISSIFTNFWDSDDANKNTGTIVDKQTADKVYLLPLSEGR